MLESGPKTDVVLVASAVDTVLVPTPMLLR